MARLRAEEVVFGVVWGGVAGRRGCGMFCEGDREDDAG